MTLIVNVDPLVTRPESKPPGVLAEALAAKYVHGCANDDWVTECAMVLRDNVSTLGVVANYHVPGEVKRNESAHRSGNVGWMENKFSLETDINLPR